MGHLEPSPDSRRGSRLAPPWHVIVEEHDLRGRQASLSECHPTFRQPLAELTFGRCVAPRTRQPRCSPHPIAEVDHSACPHLIPRSAPTTPLCDVLVKPFGVMSRLPTVTPVQPLPLQPKCEASFVDSIAGSSREALRLDNEVAHFPRRHRPLLVAVGRPFSPARQRSVQLRNAFGRQRGDTAPQL